MISELGQWINIKLIALAITAFRVLRIDMARRDFMEEAEFENVFFSYFFN